jgi:hypothetical protein
LPRVIFTAYWSELSSTAAYCCHGKPHAARAAPSGPCCHPLVAGSPDSDSAKSSGSTRKTGKREASKCRYQWVTQYRRSRECSLTDELFQSCAFVHLRLHLVHQQQARIQQRVHQTINNIYNVLNFLPRVLPLQPIYTQSTAHRSPRLSHASRTFSLYLGYNPGPRKYYTSNEQPG